MIVLVPEQADLGPFINPRGQARGPCGIGTIYDDLCVLQATWRLLQGMPEFSIPRDSRKLVESALHPDVLEELASQLGGSWKEHRKNVWGSYFAQKRHATLNLSNWEAPFGERETLFPKNERIATRLGEGDRWVHFAESYGGPFGNIISSLVVPAHLALGLPDVLKPTDIEAGGGEIRFSIEGKRFLYDRLGLRPEEVDRKLWDAAG